MPSKVRKNNRIRWMARVQRDGAIRQKLFDTKAEALAWEAAMRADEAWSPPDEKERMKIVTALDWANEYLDYAKERFSSKTYREKRDAFARLFRVTSSKGLAADVSVPLAFRLLREQSVKRSGYAANKYRKNLAAAWEWGRKYLELPERNPFRAVDKFAEERHPRHIPTEVDFWAVYEIAQEQDKIMLLAFLHTAARKMEIFRLRWDDLDFEDGRVRLWTRKRLGGTLEPDWIPMTEDLRAALLELKKRTSSLHVFAQPENGRAFTSRQHWLRTLCDRAGVPRFDIHSIRHLTASILDKSGLPLTTIQAILRHKSATTTARYLHSLRGTKAALDEVFGSGKVVSLFREKSAGAGSGR